LARNLNIRMSVNGQRLTVYGLRIRLARIGLSCLVDFAASLQQ
jgi:hypothetical protein